jgi:hypothetical protein
MTTEGVNVEALIARVAALELRVEELTQLSRTGGRRAMPFTERSPNYHRSQMSKYLRLVREKTPISDRVMEEIALYCEGVEGVGSSGTKYVEKLVLAGGFDNKDEWREGLALLRRSRGEEEEEEDAE